MPAMIGLLNIIAASAIEHKQITLSVEDMSYVFTLVVTAGAAIGVLLKYWHRIMACYERAQGFIKIVKELPANVVMIRKELTLNSGSTLRDEVLAQTKTIANILRQQAVNSQKMSLAIEAGGVGTFETDINGMCVNVSPRYCRMIGRGESEHLGSGWIHNIDMADRDKVVQEWKDSIAGGRSFEMAFSMRCESGILKILCRANPIKDPNGAIIGYFGIVEPVTPP